MSKAPRRTKKAKNHPGYLKPAFTSGGNIVVLIVSIFLCLVAIFQPWALAAIPALEILFLAFKANSSNFRAKIDAEAEQKERALRDARVNKILATLSPGQRTAYQELRTLTDQTLASYAKIQSGGILVASSETQLNGMLDTFLKLMEALNGYRRYLSATDLTPLEKELAALRTELSQVPIEDAEKPVNKIKAKRAAMIEERIQRFQQAREGREIISHQLASINDFLHLFHDEALTLHAPEMATMQIENLTMQLEANEDAMRQLENFSAVSESFALMDPMDSLPSIQTM